MAENSYKEPVKETKPGDKSESKVPGFFRSVLNGSFLTRDNSSDLLPFVFFMALIAVMLIANTYYAEKKVRSIEAMREEVTELRTIYVSNKSELMRLSNQSDIARRLQPIGLVESTVPPRLIVDEKNRRNFILRITGRN